MFNLLEKYKDHSFVQSLLTDGQTISKEREFNLSDIELDNPKFDEYEYYIHKTGFFCTHLLELFRQLENAVEMLSNFKYDYKQKIGRVDHLTYNLENYMIRLVSVSDRVLQLINATFHLGVDEKSVSERTVLKNLKVSRTNVPSVFGDFKKITQDFIRERNIIIHRHAYLDKELRRLQLFYDKEQTKSIFENDESREDFKDLRKRRLTDFIKKRKNEYLDVNKKCFEKIIPIFDELGIQYEETKKRVYNAVYNK